MSGLYCFSHLRPRLVRRERAREFFRPEFSPFDALITSIFDPQGAGSLDVSPHDHRSSHFSSVRSTEDESGWKLSVDLPGVRREDLKVELVDRVLTISAERQLEGDTADAPSDKADVCGTEDGSRCSEARGRYSWQKQFQLPQAASEEGLEAKLEYGVLTVKILKAEKAQPKSIEIRGS